MNNNKKLDIIEALLMLIFLALIVIGCIKNYLIVLVFASGVITSSFAFGLIESIINLFRKK